VIEAHLAPHPQSFKSAIPEGTKLRELFITENGEAFVDLSPEVASAHPGGALTELLTVYTIVDVLTANLPASLPVSSCPPLAPINSTSAPSSWRR
jgi:spore germination protein GerM